MSEEKSVYGDMNIIRVRKDARYFVASNVPFNDERLSWEARGVMGYLLSKPDNWQVKMTDLQHQGPAGMRIIKRVLAELRLAGYMSRKRIRRSDGTFTWDTTLYESPELNQSTMYTKTIDGSSIDGSSIDGKCIDILSTDLDLNDNEKKNQKETNPPTNNVTGEIFKAYEASIGALDQITGELIGDLIDTYPAEWIRKAFVIAVENQARNLRYISAVLGNMKLHGVDWKPPKAKPAFTSKPQQPVKPKARVMT